jgi:hypothetical protein
MYRRRRFNALFTLGINKFVILQNPAAVLHFIEISSDVSKFNGLGTAV